MRISVFPGDSGERKALLSAVERYCECEREATTVRGGCGSHSLLLDDRVLKHLIFYRRWRRALRRGEWLEDPTWSPSRAPIDPLVDQVAGGLRS